MFIPIIRKPAVRLHGPATDCRLENRDPDFAYHFTRNPPRRFRIIEVERRSWHSITLPNPNLNQAMNNSPTCPECGTPLAQGNRSGMCPACLLQAAMGGDSTLHQVPGEGGAAQSPPALSEHPGTRIGHYKLLEQIGEGGFGIVWMAEQEEPVRRRVALKIIKLGMDTREVVARFEAERQALSMMEHSNIACVFDGGATATGRPYFVMELVKGVPITTYCDVNRLTTKERLELFMEVCHAVQHAHQKGVIHRDLKPSNILVTVKDDRAVPKVIDFGIAKATQATLTAQTLFTGLNQRIGTPDYMSPEQAGLGSLDVDTRSDIYSLGVLLYELLTGRPPFDPETLLAAGYDAVMRVIREEEPPKPSTRLSTLTEEELAAVAAKRGSEPAKLNRLLRGDLDWIVMKALEKDRRRRYETANGLADDLLHHLNDEPVEAGAPSQLYLLHKLVRRHKVAVVATTTVITALIAAAAVSTWQAVVATNARKKADIAEGKAIQEQNRAEQLATERQRQLTNASWTSYNQAGQLVGVGGGIPEGEEVPANRGLREAVLRLARAVTFDPGNVEARQRFGWVVLTQRGGLCSLPVAEYSMENAGSSWLSEDGCRLVTLNDGVIRSFEAVTGRLLSESRLENPADSSIGALSPDGRLLTGIDKSHRVLVWEVTSGRKLLELQPDDDVNLVSFSADGSRIITVADQTVRVWDSGSGRPLGRLARDTKVEQVVFNRQATRVFTADEKATGRVFDASNGALLAVLDSALYDCKEVEAFRYHPDKPLRMYHGPGPSLSAEFCDDGSRLITTCLGKGNVWDTVSGRLLFTIPSGMTVDGLHLTADGKRVFGWSVSNSARSFVMSVPAQKDKIDMRELDHMEFSISRNPGDFQLSPDGSWGIISGDSGETVVIPTPELMKEQAVRGRGMVMFPYDATLHHRRPVDELRYVSDGRHIVTSSTNVTGNRSIGRQVSIWGAPPSSPGFLGFQRPHDKRKPVFSPSGEYLAIINQATNYNSSGEPLATAKGEVEIHDTRRGSLLLTLLHTGEIDSIEFNADGSRVLTWSFFEEPDPESAAEPLQTLRVWTARVWDARTGKLISEIVFPFKITGFLGGPGGFSNDGSRVLTLSFVEEPDPESAAEPLKTLRVWTARVWDARTGNLIREIVSPFKTSGSVEGLPGFSKDGNGVAFIDELHTVISIHDATSGKSLRVIKISPGKLVWCSLLDGGRLLAACEDGRVLAWDAATQSERLLYRHPSQLEGAGLSPDGSRLALYATGKPDVIVDLRTGMHLLRENKPISLISDNNPSSILPPVQYNFANLGGIHFEAYDPTGQWVLTSGFLTIELWSAKTGRLQFGIFCPGGDAAFSSDGRFFACGGRLYSTVPVSQLGQISGDAVPARDFELMARFLTARKLTDEGQVRPLDYDEWRAAGDELRARATQPGPLREWAQWLTTSGPDAPVWPGGPPMPKDVIE
jgi:serine/threonine protein kinase/WD40 repeat protein